MATYPKIIQSPHDTRSYRAYKLPNGCQTVLIHDPKTDKAAAAVSVHVGHYSDPKEYPGLAHFTEHLLFMGTKKYPEENDYSKFLSSHGGGSNAYTATEDTNYYFDVNHEHLEQALDRFAQFFVAPLFTPSGVARELNAVDSENKKNLMNDMWRLYQLDKSLSNPAHPFSKFGTGNQETLGHGDGREEVIKFWKKWYVTSLMKIAIIGRESLDELEALAKSKFADIPLGDIKPDSFPGHPLEKEQLQTLVKAKPVKEKRSIDIAFKFPDLYVLETTKPGSYLSHLIGHEGEGSILSRLKKDDYATSLSASPTHGGIGHSVMKITIHLTEVGNKNWEKVVGIVFSYIYGCLQDEPEKWIFDEIAQISDNQFKFKSKQGPSNTASRLAKDLHRYPVEKVLIGSSEMSEWKPEIIAQIRDLLRWENCKITLVSPDCDVENAEKERWYKTPYSIEQFPESLKEILKTSEHTKDTALHLPSKNEYVPSDFIMDYKENTVPDVPSLIEANEKCRLWHKKDDQFALPKARIDMLINIPTIYNTPRDINVGNLFADIAMEMFNENSYPATVAGLHYSCVSSQEGFHISVSGFNHKLGILAAKVIEQLKDFKPTKNVFDIYKEEMIRNLKNHSKQQPHQLAMYNLQRTQSERSFTPDEKLAEVEQLNFEDFTRLSQDILRNIFVETLVTGNLDKEKASAMLKSGLDKLNGQPVLPCFLNGPRVFELPLGKRWIYSSLVPTKEETNSGIEYYVETSTTGDRLDRTLIMLFCQIIDEPFFDILRTKQQLGYIVFSGVRRRINTLGLRCIIQSERVPLYLEYRIEDFLRNTVKGMLDKMSSEEFDNYKSALIGRLTEKNKDLGTESSKFWNQITSGGYDFEEQRLDADRVKDLTQSDIQKFYESKLDPNSASFTKFSSHSVSQCPPSLTLTENDASDWEQTIVQRNQFIDDPTKFKAGLTLSACARSVRPLTLKDVKHK